MNAGGIEVAVLVGFLAWTCVAVTAFPVVVLFIQVASACLWRRKAPQAPATRRPSIVVLVPAHDEGAGIVDTLYSVKGQLGEGDRLLVIADNCGDDTAQQARQAGAEVIERFDTRQRGKIYALEFGIAHLRASPPEVVIVVDADCWVADGCIDRIACQCASTGRPVQALYLMEAAGGGPGMRIAAFAWAVKNRVRPLGFLRWGLPCQVMGSGIAYPWQKINDVPVANGFLVEDFKLGLDLAAAGAAPQFCPDAWVSSRFPANAAGREGQRRRWEHGSLSLIGGALPLAAFRAVKEGNLPLLAMVIDLFVPPLAFLSLAVFGLVALVALTGMAGGGWMPLAAAGIVVGMLIVSVFLGWYRFGRDIVSFADLMTVPAYAASKIPLYIKFFSDRQRAWERTQRDG